MKSDIQIAQETQMLPIKEVAAAYGITEDDLELYGKYKAKLSDDFLAGLSSRPDGKLVLVTAINPTPAGEGKTTTSVGLGPVSYTHLRHRRKPDHLPAGRRREGSDRLPDAHPHPGHPAGVRRSEK